MSNYDTQRRSAWPRILVAACIALTGACDEHPPTTPTGSGFAIEGRWTGTMLDRSAGTGTFEVALGDQHDVIGIFAEDARSQLARLLDRDPLRQRVAA